MDTKVNPAVVGAFVLALAFVGIGVLLWLGSGQFSRKAYDTYLAFFSDSVSGLNVRSSVKVRGVEVGAVQAIALDPSDPARVRVVLSIEKGTPVKEDTYATLGVQGLTGIAYVELEGGTRASPPLQAKPGEALPVIRTRPSLFSRLDLAATSLVGDLDRVTTRLNEMLDPGTREAFQSLVSDLSRVTRTLARRSDEIDASVVATSRLLENLAHASAALPRLIERIGRSADAVEHMGSEVSRAGVAAQAALDGARGTIEQASSGLSQARTEVLPEVERLLVDLRETNASLGRVTAELERDPSMLVLGRAQPAPGPGE